MEISKHYSVKEVVELTGEEQGTVELFRKELQENKILDNNGNLNEEQLELFKSICSFKRKIETTWDYAITKKIHDFYVKGNVDLEKFKIHEDLIIEDLIYQIENGQAEVSKNTESSDGFHEVYRILIENFVKRGAYDKRFENSFGTDGNPVPTYKVVNRNLNCFYYLIGKRGSKSKEEELHVFYNDGLFFNVMKIKYIIGGIIDKEEIINKLFKVAREKYISQTEV